jgi:cation transport ATPase
MKRKTLIAVILLVLAAIAGYVLSKASLVGRVGISLFYKQYKFLKVWWQAGLLVFVIWMILFFLQGLAQRRSSATTAKLIQIGAIVVALAGLFFTYQDFRHTTSHRWLGERFHLGGYLFWIGWIIISVFYLTEKRETSIPTGGIPVQNTMDASDAKNV